MPRPRTDVTTATVSSPLRRESDVGAGVLARRFGDTLRVGDGGTAERVMDDALAAGMSPEAIQTLVIAPAMVRIGELWECGAIGVADEHLASSISQRALIRLFATLSARRVHARSRERVLLAAVEGQHHVLGLRMVADVLEGAGFDVLYLGEDVPVDSLRDSVSQHRPSVVGLSVGIAADVRCLADSLAGIHETAPETRVMLGGRAVPPGLRGVGYPFVENTMDVGRAVEELLASPAPGLPAEVELLRSHSSDLTWPPVRTVETDAVAERLATAADHAVDLAREHVRRAEIFRDLAFRDPLTGMANRRAFEEALGAFTGQSSARGSLLMIDVDAFKAVNDTLGHDAGDRVLRSIAHAISSAVRPGDTAARVGGDEFAVLLPGALPARGSEVGDRILAAVADQAESPISVSIGVASVGGESRGALLAADTALYEAKAAGRNCVIPARSPAQPTPQPAS